VKNDADEKEERLKEVNVKLEEVILDAAQKEQQLKEIKEQLKFQGQKQKELENELEARLVIRNENSDRIEERIGEVAERCFGLIKLLSQIISHEHDVEIDEEEMNEFVSSVIVLKEHGNEKEEKNTETSFKIFGKDYVFPEIDVLAKRLPLEIKKSYEEKVMVLFNAMEDDRFYEFGNEEIYVKVNLHDYQIGNNFIVFFQHFLKIRPFNDRYCVRNDETVSFSTGNRHDSVLYLYHHDGYLRREERKWFYNHVNGDNDIPSEKDITEVQFINAKENDRKIMSMEERSRNPKYWKVEFNFSYMERAPYIFKDGENQYFLLCFKTQNTQLTTEEINE